MSNCNCEILDIVYSGDQEVENVYLISLFDSKWFLLLSVIRMEVARYVRSSFWVL